MKDFIVFCGDNNTGKTYATYAIYSLLGEEFKYKFKETKEIIDNVLNRGIYELDLIEFSDLYFSNLEKE